MLLWGGGVENVASIEISYIVMGITSILITFKILNHFVIRSSISIMMINLNVCFMHIYIYIYIYIYMVNGYL